MSSPKPLPKRPRGRWLRPVGYASLVFAGLLFLSAGVQVYGPERDPDIPKTLEVAFERSNVPSGEASASPSVPSESAANHPKPEIANGVVDAPESVTEGSKGTAATAGPAVDQGADTVLDQGTGSTLSAVATPPSSDYLGVRDSYRRVVIAFDVADSVRRKAAASGVPLTRIRDETAALVSRLPSGSAFNLIQFVRRYDAFAPVPVAADATHKAEALEWLQNRFRTDGRSGRGWTGGEPDGVELLLQRALNANPEVIFIVSDGDFQRTRADNRHSYEDVPWPKLEDLVAHWQLQTGRRVRIHVIGFGMPTDLQEDAARFVARFGGQMRVIDPRD